MLGIGFIEKCVATLVGEIEYADAFDRLDEANVEAGCLRVSRAGLGFDDEGVD